METKPDAPTLPQFTPPARGTARRSRALRKRRRPLFFSGRRFVRCFGLRPLQWTCRLANLRTTTVLAPQHDEAVYRLRYEIYRGEGFIAPTPEASFQDAFDDWSEQILIHRGAKPIATCRLILGAHPNFKGYWTDSLFALKALPPAAETAEVSRFGVDRADRGKSGLVFLALLLAIHDAAHRHAIRYLIVNMPLSLARLVQQYGIRPYPLEQASPEPRHLDNRKLISGYFARKRLLPYVFHLDDIIQTFRLKPLVKIK